MPQTAIRRRHTAKRLFGSLAIATLLTACGYKGPLYMPPPPAPDESLTTPPTSSTLPGTEAATDGAAPPTATPSPVK